jgi:hypothetical protein
VHELNAIIAKKANPMSIIFLEVIRKINNPFAL